MLYVDIPSTPQKLMGRLSYDDDNLITIDVKKDGGSDNWGDDDCNKPVTTVFEADIKIDKSIADDFKNVNNITFLRWDYYRKAYSLHRTKQIKEILDDGSIIFHTTKGDNYG